MIDDAYGANILVLAPNWLGDGVMCTPALRALRRRFPQARLTVAARQGICEALDDLSWIDHRAVLPEKPSLAAMLSLARHLRPYGRDLVVVFPHSFRAAVLAWFIHSRERIGYARNGRALLFTKSLSPHKENANIAPVYMAQEYLALVALLGCNDDNEGLELGVSADIAHEVQSQIDGRRPLVGIAPGAAFGPSKRWMPEAFAKAAEIIASQCDASFVLLTGPGEEGLRDTIKRHTGIPFLELKIDCGGLAALKAIIAHLDVLICNDSGPRHIAVAFKRPVVCVMGPTSPRYSEGPYELGQRLQASLPCIPCQQPECPLGHQQCMRDITPTQVANAALQYLTNRSRSSASDD